jgi:proteasome accessory factor B
MPRGAEVVRQWTILQAIDGVPQGLSVAALAKRTGVHKRTVWRDLAALQEAGFPLYDEARAGETIWKLNTARYRGFVERGFTLTQLCALYFSRAVVESLAGTPFHAELGSVFDQIQKSLPPRMRTFLDALPRVINAKPAAVKRRESEQQPEHIARLLDATLHQRRVEMRYHSISRNRTKDYAIDPYRLAYADGGLYLLAFVPEYGEVRTFAVERIKRLTVLDATFERVRELPADAFTHSLGAFAGPPVRVELEFAPRVAPYVRERQWHQSQQTRERPDGSIRMTLEVSNDWSLRSWVLGFGPFVRVVSPPDLAQEILDELARAQEQYAPRIEFEMPSAMFGAAGQGRLPLGSPKP